MERVGIIGQGFVGTAVREKFKQHFTVMAYDKFNTELSINYTGASTWKTNADVPTEHGDDLNNVNLLVQMCNVIFVCVPTPMYENGECDTRIVESVIRDIAKEAEDQNRPIVSVVKSTVPPGTTKKLNEISEKVTVTFSPEFLTEANAIQDFENQTRIVLGIDYLEVHNVLVNMFRKCFPTADIIRINSQEAEMVKYTTNLFLATKVSFFNDIYQLCQKMNIEYDDVIEATMHDPRIGKSHYMVPGPDGDLGYGGHCFPKDMNAIMFLAEQMKLALPTITGAHTTNQIVRQNRDWEEMEGRAVSKRDSEGYEAPENYNEIANK